MGRNCFGKATTVLNVVIILGIINIALLHYAKRGCEKQSILVEDNYSTGSKAQESANYLEELKSVIDETYRGFHEREFAVDGELAKAEVTAGQSQVGYAVSKSNRFPALECKDNLFLLIQVHSAPFHFLEREAIRLSWGRQDNSINKASSKEQPLRRWRTVFLIGQTGDPVLDIVLDNEVRSYGDLVFGDFLDSYRNLTLKMALGISWATNHCNTVQYVLKTDDDSYVNVNELIKWLGAQNSSWEVPLYAGAILTGNPSRDMLSPYYVSEEEYPEPNYPPYVFGAGYVYSGHLLPRLSKALGEVKLFTNEDACFGVLMKHIKITPINVERFTPFTMQVAFYQLSRGYSLCQFNGPLVIHRISGIFQIQTHFNALILKHAPTICHHIDHGIGNEIEYFIDDTPRSHSDRLIFP